MISSNESLEDCRMASVVKEVRGSSRRSAAKKRLAQVAVMGEMWADVRGARKLFRTTKIERVKILKSGVPARYTRVLAQGMSVSKEKLYATVGLTRATVDRKVQKDDLLNADESERVMGIARLVGQVQTMVEESGNPRGFEAARWLAGWLDRPLPALGGKLPAEFMDTADGRALVSDLLAQQQSGAYA
jgi:putative toxin-antitoxin system antitoxin component (TIGR02293 family)